MKKFIPLFFLFLFSCGGSENNIFIPATGNLSVSNNTYRPMTGVYLSAPNQNFGPNLISETTEHGNTANIYNISPGTYDFCAAFTTALSSYYSCKINITINAGETHTIALNLSELTGSVEILNIDSYAITKIYIFLPSATTWGRNRITVPLQPGYSTQITGLDPDTYNLVIVYSDNFMLQIPITIEAGKLLKIF